MVLVGHSPPTNISLTCIIELPASVDTPVDVNIMWTGPHGAEFIPGFHHTMIYENNQPARYSSMVTMIRSGHYMCNTSVTSPSEFISGNAMASQVYDIISGKADIALKFIIFLIIPVLYDIVVPVNMTLLRQPTGHLRIGNSLRLSCTITIAIQLPSLNSSNINVSISWTKMGQSSSDRTAHAGMFNTSSEVTESGGLYMYLSTLVITPLMFSDSASYTCAAVISPYSNSSNLFNSTEQSATILVQLSKLACADCFFIIIITTCSSLITNCNCDEHYFYNCFHFLDARSSGHI